jgi:hypothetical protein
MLAMLKAALDTPAPLTLSHYLVWYASPLCTLQGSYASISVVDHEWVGKGPQLTPPFWLYN